MDSSAETSPKPRCSNSGSPDWFMPMPSDCPDHSPCGLGVGRLNVPDPMPVVDGLTAATALMHDWTLIMRNVDDVASTGMRLLDPFTGVSSPVQRLAGFV